MCSISVDESLGGVGGVGKGKGPAAEKPAVYRAPGSTGTLAARMKAERGVDKPSGGARKIDRAEVARASAAYIPGMAPPETNKPSKNARKQVLEGKWGRGLGRDRFFFIKF